jgi:hypothetical protein
METIAAAGSVGVCKTELTACRASACRRGSSVVVALKPPSSTCLEWKRFASWVVAQPKKVGWLSCE